MLTADLFSYRIVKVPHRPADLEQRLRRLGWHIKVTSTSGPFYWGAGGTASRRPAPVSAP